MLLRSNSTASGLVRTRLSSPLQGILSCDGLGGMARLRSNGSKPRLYRERLLLSQLLQARFLPGSLGLDQPTLVYEEVPHPTL